MSRYERTLFQYFDRLSTYLRSRPLNLGGISGTQGGSGGPPGGFVGYLPQTRVSYDETEAALSGFVESGYINESGVIVSGSLLDNLNHIRYRIEILEAGGGGAANIFVYDNGVEVISGVSILDFYDNLDVTDLGGGHARIDALDEKSKVSSNDTTSDYLENKIIAGTNITIAVLNEGANEDLEISVSGISDTDETVKVTSNDTTTDYLFSKLSAGTYIVLSELNDGGNEQVEISVSGVPDNDEKAKVSSNDTLADYLENKIVAGDNILITVLNEGGDEDLQIAVSGIEGEKAKVSSNDTLADYLQNKIVEGTNISITVLNEGGNEQLEITSTASGGGGNSVYGEDLTSQVPGTDFTTNNVFESGTLRVYYNGLRQRDIYITAGGEFQSFTTTFTTISGDSMIVDYELG